MLTDHKALLCKSRLPDGRWRSRRRGCLDPGFGMGARRGPHGGGDRGGELERILSAGKPWVRRGEA